MARRSARLQKRSPTPSDSSRSSWETAQSHSSPQNEILPSVSEVGEPAINTPQKLAVAAPSNAAGKVVSASQLLNAGTTTARTPKKHTPIKPAGEEMHPAHHHASTAKVLDEARWLGFQALGAHTAPPNPSAVVAGQTTPSKTPVPANTRNILNTATSPEFRFRFRFKSPLSGLSPKSSSILKDRKEDTDTDGRALFKADEFTAPADMSAKRKTAVPKGKMSRFSDVHLKEFKKMDSIANHASAFRADPSRFKPVSALSKSPSKVDLQKPESSQAGSNKLKRTQSKIDVTESATKAPSLALKRTQSKIDLGEQTTKIPPTPLKRTQSKMDMTGSSLPRSQSTVRLVPPSRNGRPSTQDGNPFAKRVKRTEMDDAATTRPNCEEGKATDDNISVTAPAAPARKITSQTALPRLASRLMTPTKSSIARSQSVKTLKSQSMIHGSSMLRSPSTRTLFSPTNIGEVVKESVRDGIRKTSNSLQRVRSILRTPNRKFSEDPSKIAAGTHMSPPSSLDLGKALPEVPHTAPVKKHVNFTNSTLERASQDELGKSPSPMKFRAGSEVPSGAVIYPTLRGTGNVQYPAIRENDESSEVPVSSSRRLTFGGATVSTPGEFSFKSDKPINFPTSAGTIRMVRKSDASSLTDGKKRKLAKCEENSDKENSEPAPEEAGRSAKKMKPTPAEPPRTPSKSTSMLPRRTPKLGSSISKSRLAFLATPKRGKA